MQEDREQIVLQGLTKVYRIPRKAPGLWASVKSVFSRVYEEVEAVRELTFTIAGGERVGFLGPNGAGKTTTLKMLSGLLWPTAGQVHVLGFEPRFRTRAFLSAITLVMGQKQQLLWDLPPIETFELNRIVYRIPMRNYQETLDELVALLELEPLLTKPTRQLSLGERMKCELTAALLHRPRVLFLDEPTIGLDITMQAQVRRFIRSYNERTGATILLTSHDMDDVQELCPRVIVIDRGRLRYDGSLEDLVRETIPEKRISIHFAAPVPRRFLEGIGRVRSHTDCRVEIDVPAGEIHDVISHLLTERKISDLKVEDPPLEDVMERIFTPSSDRK